VDVIRYGIPYWHWIRLYIYIYIERERERETGLRAGRPGFSFRQGSDVYYLSRRVRDGCGVHLSGGSYHTVKAAGREADHPPPSSAKTKNERICTFSPQHFLMACCLIKQWILFLLRCLLKHRDHFSFAFYLLWNLFKPSLNLVLNMVFCRFPAAAGNSSLHHRVQNGSGAHPAFYPMDTGGYFPGAWTWPFTPSSSEVKNACSYISTPQ
jgi:hypothetical protein